MMRHRSPLGRSRLSSRRDRRPPPVLQAAQRELAAALQVAREFVYTRWPELGCVEPRITTQIRRRPSVDLLKRLGVEAPERVPDGSDGTEYTFTFARDDDAENGFASPLVATVTVDDHRHIVKALVSK